MKDNIGIVTTWFERGAAYVSKIYMQLLQKQGYSVYIFARGGESQAKKDPNWDLPNVTWSKNKKNTFKISRKEILSWIDKNHITKILFNEQQDFRILAELKSKRPNIVLGAYVDYYTEKTLPLFNIYDFLICNTHRHMQAMNFHKNAKYMKWGTDISLYNTDKNVKNKDVTFFHSVGMSPRKGTDVLIDAFIEGELYKKSKLIVHTQIPIENVCSYTNNELSKYNIQIIQKTVTAPGLYYLGDIYVYPTRLDGLGLTMYEALASGLPVITTNYPPMNEVVDDNVGALISVERNYCRSDAYYWPMSVCEKKDLICKLNYFINNKNIIQKFKKNARDKAVKEFNILNQGDILAQIIDSVHIEKNSFEYIELIKDYYKSQKIFYRILKKLKMSH